MTMSSNVYITARGGAEDEDGNDDLVEVSPPVLGGGDALLQCRRIGVVVLLQQRQIGINILRQRCRVSQRGWRGR